MRRAAAAGLAAVVVCLGTACSGASVTPAGPEVARAVTRDSASTLIVGDWAFVRACGGIAGGCRAAGTVSEPTRYVFRANGTLTAYRDGSETFTSSYTISPGSSTDEGDRRPILLIGAGPTVDPRPLRISFVGRNTLLLDEGCCDRFTFEYQRR